MLHYRCHTPLIYIIITCKEVNHPLHQTKLQINDGRIHRATIGNDFCDLTGHVISTSILWRSRVAGSKLDPDQKHEDGRNEVQVYCSKAKSK